MRLKYLVPLLSFCSLFCEHAYADSSESSGVYVGVGVGGASIDSLERPAYVIEGNLGYNFNDYLALEVQANGMPSTQWQSNLLNSYNVFNLAVKGTMPLGNTFSLYGKLGAGLGISNWSGDGSETDEEGFIDCSSGIYSCPGTAQSAILLGTIGASFKLTKDFAIFIENNNFVPVGGSNGRFGYTANGVIGLQYSFYSTSPSASHQEKQLIDCDNNPYQDGCIAPIIKPKIEPVTIPVVADQPVIEIAPPVIVAQPQDQRYQNRLFISQNGDKYIIIKNGDTLYGISKNFDIPEITLKQLNKLNFNKVIIGQKLYLYRKLGV